MENKIIIVSAQTDAEYPNVLWDVYGRYNSKSH